MAEVMEAAKYRLDFEDESSAEAAFSLCEKAAENTLWQGKTVAGLNSVLADDGKPSAEDEFSSEAYEDEQTVFQKLCRKLAEEKPDLFFRGVCHYQSGREKIRISVIHDADGLSYEMRLITPEEISFQRMICQREKGGRLTGGYAGKPRIKSRESRER